MTVRDFLALAIIVVFLLVTVGIIVMIPLGVTDVAGAKDMLQTWASTYSILVGAVVGAYFPRQQAPGRP